MDGLRKLAVAAFEGEKRFSDTVHEFTFIQAQPNNEQRTIIQPRKIPKNEIVSRMAAKPSATSGRSSSPELKLVQIQIADPSPFYIEKQLFLQTFEALQLEPYILHLILLNSYGFHRFPAAPSPTNNQVISSYFVSTIMYMLAWSFNPVTLETKAILMTRTANGMTTFEEVEYYFGNILSVYADHINSPTFLSLVAGTHLVHFLDEYILHQLIGTRELEACTGYGDIVPIESELDVNAITRLSKKTGRILTVLANIHRHLLISDAVISDVSRTLDSLDPKQTVILPVDSQTIHVKRNEPLVNVVSALETQIIWNKSYVAYLLERAKSQTAVLQGLRTQDDATQSINLATASANFAEAAMHDSSAMKTIAVMTMLFLPGTFFAALFAVPSLKWDESNVIQEKFWVYWAFTLPTTALVFIIWKLLTKWNRGEHGGRARGTTPRSRPRSSNA